MTTANFSPPAGVRLIGVASDLGAPLRGSAQGPKALRRLGLDLRLSRRGVPAVWQGVLHPRPGPDPVLAQAELCARLARQIEHTVRAGERFAVLGGDHSCAVGTWSGVAAALAERGETGLVWIDAHMDSHLPATSPSGALHGMPVACLLGYGEEALVNLGGFAPKLRPHRLCLVGVRDFEPDERALLNRLGVRVFPAEEVSRRGLAAVLDEAVARVRDGAAGYGISIDLDALDPADAPGVGTPAPGGLRGEALVQALRGAARDPRFLGLEIAELDPGWDHDRVTAYLTAELVNAAFDPEPAPAAGALLTQTGRFCADNYDSFPVVLSRGAGAHLFDVDGRRYLDMMGAYSAASHGHAHPRLVQVLTAQARRLTITSRAFQHDRLGPFLQRLCELAGQDRALPMNTGAEAVETALKAARRWAYRVKGVAADRAEIIVCRNNFHGRTTTIVGFSSEPKYREDFGPFAPGFRTVPFGDPAALADAIGEHTAAFLVEPIQGEAGIVVPPAGYLAECARICRERRVLLLCDEVQTGLGRTGRFLASEYDGVKPDGLILGKALGGGMLPVSAFLARNEVMGGFGPGDHGSTFGGNPLAAAVGLEALDVIVEERLAERSAELGAYLLQRLRDLDSSLIREVRGRGLFIGLELHAGRSGRDLCLRLMARGILTRETHGTVIRFAPPLVIERSELDRAVAILAEVLRAWEDGRDSGRPAATPAPAPSRTATEPAAPEPG